jgi:signal transduction histidine kinase
MTLRIRLMILTLLGLAMTMAVWGWIQIRALDKILIDQQTKTLTGLADTVSTYYEFFPTRRGLAALDRALKDLVQDNVNLARIDIFSLSRTSTDFVAGAGRIPYEWPELTVTKTAETRKPEYIKLDTDGGPAIGLLYPGLTDKKDEKIVVGVIVFSQGNTEILAQAKYLLMISSVGLLFVILLILAVSYGWLIARPLNIIIHTIDEFQAGNYVRRIPFRRRDEWGRLAAHFNEMADEVEQVLEKNQELNRNLAERVQEATLNVVQLQKQVNQLQQLTALGYLTATLAHDLGTPLHSIAGLARLLLERGEWPPDVRRKIELIVQQTERLNMVIQNVRRATRPPEPHFESLSVQDLFNETLPLVEPLMQQSGIVLNVREDPGLPQIYADRYRLQTALFNLLQNAAEAMPAGGEVTVSTFAEAAESTVAIRVRDNGPGIEADVMSKICEPFFSTHTEEGMRGLGLAIVQDIMKIHGGRIDIHSSPGEGAEVTLFFPMITTPGAPQPPFANNPPASVEAPRSTNINFHRF